MSARVQHATITFNGSAQRLSTVLPNIGLRQISIQADSANANVFYLGGENVDSSNYGVVIPVPVSSVPAAPFVLEFEDGGVELGDYYVSGTNTQKAHVLIMAAI